MLIERNLMAKVEKYFIKNYPKAQFGEDYDERFYKVVNIIIEMYKCDPEKSRFIEKALTEKRPWNIIFRDKFHIGRRTYFAWRQEILSDAVVCALEQGIITFGLVKFLEEE